MSTQPKLLSVSRLPVHEPGDTGNLFETPAYALLRWAAAKNFTGRITFDGENQYEVLEILNGLVQGDDITDLENRLLRMIGWFSGQFTLHRTQTPKKTAALSIFEVLENVEQLLLKGVARSDPTRYRHIPPQGDLLNFSAWALLSKLASEHFSGRVLIYRANDRKLLRWRNGLISSISSTDAKETLAVVLKRWGYLQDPVVDSLESKARNEQARFRDILRREKAITEEELREALATLHFERLVALGRWRAGVYMVREDLAESILRLGNGHTSVLAVSLSDDSSLLEWGKEIVSVWGELHPRSCLVSVGMGPQAETSTEPSAELLQLPLETLPSSKAKWLNLFPENDSWRTADGTRHIRRLITKLNTDFSRVLWICAAPPPGSPLLSGVGPIVLIVESGKTKKSTLNRMIQQYSAHNVQGFIFKEPDAMDEDQNGSTASPMVKSITKLLARFQVQALRTPLEALRRKFGSSAARR